MCTQTFELELLDFSNPTSPRTVHARVDEPVDHVYLAVLVPEISLSYLYVPHTKQIAALQKHMSLNLTTQAQQTHETQAQQSSSSSFCPLVSTQRDMPVIVEPTDLVPLTLWDLKDITNGDYPSLILYCQDDQELVDLGRVQQQSEP